MPSHANATLTVTQRTLVRELTAQGVSQASLAQRFGIHRRTIQRWVARMEPTNRASASHQHGRQVVAQADRAAVFTEQTAQPQHGPQPIADDLRVRFPTTNRATIVGVSA
jgi:transposase